jgi:serine/threonine protein kinase
MLTGSLPFQSDEMPRLFQKISKGVFVIPPTVTKEAADLIRRLLCKEPRDRITAKECLSHPWLSPMVALSSPSSELTLISSTKKKMEVDGYSLHSTLRESAEYQHKKISFFTRLFVKKARVAPCNEMSKKMEQEKLVSTAAAKKLGMLNQFKGFFHALFSKEARLNGA